MALKCTKISNHLNLSSCLLIAVVTMFSRTLGSESFDSEDNIVSSLRVAQCRATCLEKFSNDGPGGEIMCLQGPDCFMCWENCDLLQSNSKAWRTMCEEKEICFPGCQEACRFHTETTTRYEPSIYKKGQPVIKIRGDMANWQRPPQTVNVKTPLVYIVMYRSESGPWRQIIQTILLASRVPANASEDDTTLRVLVVSSEGLVTVYSPDVSEMDVTQKKRKKTVNTEKKVVGDNEKWEVRLSSLIRQKVLVVGEISWAPKSRKGLYLVTWELDGGGLKGNLFTDSTRTSLSLWPETLYHVQVELVSRIPGVENLKSEILDLDTRKALLSVPNVKNSTVKEYIEVAVQNETDRGEYDHLRSSSLSVLIKNVGHDEDSHYSEFLAGCATAILLFVFLLAIISWRCRIFNLRGGFHDRTGAQKLVEDFFPYKGSSIVTTMTPPEQCSKGTSTENRVSYPIDFQSSSQVITTFPQRSESRRSFFASLEDINSEVKV